MIPIHFHAVFVPQLQAFQVSVVFPRELPKPNEQIFAADGQYRIQLDLTKPNAVEIMSPSDFILWARSDGPMVIDGKTITIEESSYGIAEMQVRAYFRQVADSYLRYVTKKN